MRKLFMLAVPFSIVFVLAGVAEDKLEEDIIKTSEGDLKITFVGHGTLIFTFGDKVIHVDPVTREADYTKMPKADFIIITHEHGDHLDPEAIKLIRTEKTQVILTEKCAQKVEGGIVIKNGTVLHFTRGDDKSMDISSILIDELKIEAVPAYNIISKRDNGVPFHPKGDGNGYVITFGDKRVYVAGDTENIPEMKELKDIDIAFLPMNLPYTMSPEMVAESAKIIKPKILYPYHFGKTDTSKLLELMKDEKDIEVRIRDME